MYENIICLDKNSILLRSKPKTVEAHLAFNVKPTDNSPYDSPLSKTFISSKLQNASVFDVAKNLLEYLSKTIILHFCYSDFSMKVHLLIEPLCSSVQVFCPWYRT